ncbi:MAG: glycosyltransferase family 39 protein [candidate division WWE3 bacterium]|nr:glycosyltransferase family 39 protein [candidate division WWE3 bacterium]
MINYNRLIVLTLFFSVVIVGILGVVRYNDFNYLGSVPASNAHFTLSIILKRALNLNTYYGASGVDLARINGGDYLPVYAPGYSFAAALPYGLLQIFNHFWVRFFNPLSESISLFLESTALALPSILSTALISVLIYKLLLHFKVSKTIAVITAWSFPFATFLLGYTSTTYNGLLAASLLLLAFYWLVVPEKYNLRIPLLVGLLFGMIANTEYVVALCFIPSLVYFYIKTRDKYKTGIVVAGFMAGMLALGLYNNALFGKPWTFGEQFTGTAFRTGADLTSITFSGNLWQSLYGNLLSPAKGLIFQAPLSLLAVPGLIYLFKRRRSSAVLVISYIAIVALVYAFWHDWGGGWTTGPRFYTAIVAFLIIAAGYFFSEIKRKTLVAPGFFGLILFGVLAGATTLLFGPRDKFSASYDVSRLRVIQRLEHLFPNPVSVSSLAPYIPKTFGVSLSAYLVLLTTLILGSLIILIVLSRRNVVSTYEK